MTELKLKHRLCFPFCSDLGNKKIYEAKKGLDDQINIKWSLFRVKQHTSIMGGGGRKLPNSDIIIPGNYSIERVKGDWTSAWGDPEYTTFMAPDDYYRNGRMFYETKPNEINFTIDLPKELEEQPHLHKHSTFIFSYLKEDLISCSCQFLGCEDNKIKIEIQVAASPSGTCLLWKSGLIFKKWKIEVRQDIVVMNLVKEHLQDMWKTSKKIGKGILKFASLGAIDLNDSDAKGLIEKMASESGGKDHWKKMGMDKEKIQRNQEKQMERFVTSTVINEATLAPPILASETVHFPYNLFDYGLRSVFKPHWQYRIYVSENLLNNLIHNNNINPITYPLNITFTKLAKVLKKGYYQGELRIVHDPGKFLTTKFKEGITFFEDMEKDFADPNLGVKSLVDQVGLTGFAGEHYQAEEIREPGEGITIDIPYAADQRGYGHSTYIKFTNSSVMDDFKNSLATSCGANFTHYDSSNGFCWGCTYDNLNAVNFGSTKFTPSSSCSVNMKLSTVTSDIKDFDLKAGTEYTVTINSSQFVFKAQDKSRIVLQKVPGHNDFDNMDWTPPLGSGGDIEIPLMEPDIALPEPDAGVVPPEPDPSPDLFDPTGGEPEITIEPDVPDVEPDLPEVDIPDFDVPDIEITPDVPDTDIPDADPTLDSGDNDVPDIPDGGFDPKDYE